MLDGVFSLHVFTPDGVNYRMQATTDRQDPIGAVARPGESPPIILSRGASCGIDLFAAEMHRVPEPLDASIDAHSVDAGGVEQ